MPELVPIYEIDGFDRVYFAIRHIPSGHYLPHPPRTVAFTHLEPAAGYPPRLFDTSADAKRSLWYWLSGRMYRDEDGGIRTTKEAGRFKEDMEVVPIGIKFLENT